MDSKKKGKSKEGKDKIMPLRISEEDWALISDAANADGIRTVSTWVRQQAIFAARKALKKRTAAKKGRLR